MARKTLGRTKPIGSKQRLDLKRFPRVVPVGSRLFLERSEQAERDFNIQLPFIKDRWAAYNVVQQGRDIGRVWINTKTPFSVRSGAQPLKRLLGIKTRTVSLGSSPTLFQSFSRAKQFARSIRRPELDK